VFDRITEKFGDVVTMDNVTFNAEGTGGFKYALVIVDLHTDFKRFIPLEEKASAATLMAIKEYVGMDYVAPIYSDRAGELKKASRALKINWEGSMPGRPQNNARAEKQVQDAIDGIKRLTMHAGLPGCFWPLAGRWYATMENARPRKNTLMSPYEVRFGKPLRGIMLPFGQGVHYKPNKVTGKHIVREKATPDTSYGILV